MSVENNIPNDWVETTLGEVCEITSSKRIFAKEYQTSGIPFFRGKEVTEKFNGNDISTELFITEEKYNEIKKTYGVPIEKDILLTSVGTLGNPYLVEKDFEFYFKDGNLTWFKNFNDTNSKFLFYWIVSPQGKENLSHARIGSTQQAYTMTALKQVEIIKPPLPEQTSIAKILTAFDDKIELLQAQNKTLEATAQTIFKEWFGKYQIDDELPDGWKVGKIGDFITETIGGDYGKETSINDFTKKTICLRGTDLPDMKMGVPEKAPVRFLKLRKIEKCKLINGDIVIEISGGTENQSTGRVAYINEYILSNSEHPMTCVNFCRILRLKDVNNTYFIYSLFEYLYKRKVLFNWENGTTGIKNLNLKALLKDFDLALPISSEMIDKYNQIVKSSFIKIQENNSQIQALKQTRDTLLPKLVSGALRVDEFKENAV